MKRPYLSGLDYSTSLLSAFDISGSLLLRNPLCQPKGINHDLKQLMNDLDTLEEDYRTAYEKVAKDQAE